MKQIFIHTYNTNFCRSINYDEKDVEIFTTEWIEGIQDDYSGKMNEPSDPGFKLAVEVPKFNGNNWKEW